jgi:hypothetical protein
VCREEEGTSSNRPKLEGVVLALQSAALSEDVLLLCDNAEVLCVIKKWVGKGGKATALYAGILREIVCLLIQCVRAGRATFLIKCLRTHRVRAGRATFLIKVKLHRGQRRDGKFLMITRDGTTEHDGSLLLVIKVSNGTSRITTTELEIVRITKKRRLIDRIISP